jgi:hypothetical protein
MTNALSATHWLIVAGAILVALGLIEFGFRQKQGR